PCTSPRSRRIDTSVIASTGLRARPTTNDLLTLSMRSAGAAVTPAAEATGIEVVVVFSCSVRVAVTGGLLVVWAGKEEPRASSDNFVGGPRGSGSQSCHGRRHQKSRGPDLAHGSWLFRSAVLPPAASSRWAQISRGRRRR